MTRRVTGGQSELLFGPGKPLAILVYLLLSPGRSASRERIVDLLWSDFEPEAGRKQLRNALSSLRSRIGPWIIEDRDRSCVLSAALSADVLEFRAAIERGCLKEALNLYNDFLAGFASPGATEFEHWAEGERTHFRSLAASAAEMCCREALDAGRSKEARSWSDRLRAIDPDSELAWRVSLETTARTGDRLGALNEAERFEGWLGNLGRDPEPASRAALRVAREATAPSGDHSDGSPALIADLVGREREFNAVVDAWARTRAGQRQTVLISGPAGLGKSRLLDDLKRRFRFRRHRIVLVRALSGERTAPFSFLVALIHELTRLSGAGGVSETVASTLLAIDPRVENVYRRGSPDSATVVELPNRRSVALQELLAALSDESPFALFIDDYHWMDERSREALSNALSRTSASRVLVVIASRSSLPHVEGEIAPRHLKLAPLSEPETEQLIESLGALPSASWTRSLVTRVTQVSSGSPLLVLTALRQLLADGTIELDETGWRFNAQREGDSFVPRVNPIEARLREIRPSHFRVVLACGVAGVPLRRDVLARVQVDDSERPDDAMEELERLGHLREAGGLIETSHDAIGEAAIRIADSATRQDVEHRLGLSLVEEADAPSLERGIRHLVRTGDDVAAIPALTRLVRKRQRERPQPLRPLVASILALDPNSAEVTRAIKELPHGVRVMRYRAPLAAASLVLVAGVAGALIAVARPASTPDAVLELFVREDLVHARTALIPLRAATWSTTQVLTADWSKPRVDTIPRPEFGALVEPGRDAWLHDWTAPDTGRADIALYEPDRFAERLTRSHFDETPGSWSPDGRQIAIASSQFGDSGHKVIAILDRASGRIRPLNKARYRADRPLWSPDGARIAYSRQRDDGSVELCFSTVDASSESCARRDIGYHEPFGWMTEDQFLIGADDNRIESLDVGTGALRLVREINPETRCDLSPEGRWLACRGPRSVGGAELTVVSARDPDDPRRITSSFDPKQEVRFSWRGVPQRNEYLDSMIIAASNDTVPVASTVLVQAVGRSNLGRNAAVHALRWSSSDPSIATVDSTGAIHGIREGDVVIEASAGGWRFARRRFYVVHETASVVLREDWTRPLDEHWQPFGDPRPRIVQDSVLGHAFWNDGDGTYFSGAYTKSPALSARDGLALDAVVRMRITREQWQYLNIGFLEIVDAAALLKQWDHKTGYIWQARNNDLCSLSYPPGEGRTASLRAGDTELRRAPGVAKPPIALGAPTRIRVQIFSDGRCGVAVDGQVVEIGPPGGSLDSLHVIIQGNSVDTRVLVGPITVRKGVPDGVDWDHAP